MTCDDYELMISSLVDGDLHGHRCAELFAHLSACTGCERFLRTLLAVKRTAAGSQQDHFPASAAAVILRQRIDAPPTKLALQKLRPSTTELLQRHFSISVCSAFIATLMLILWAVVLSYTLLLREPRTVNLDTERFPQTYMLSTDPRLSMDPSSRRPQ